MPKALLVFASVLAVLAAAVSTGGGSFYAHARQDYAHIHAPIRTIGPMMVGIADEALQGPVSLEEPAVVPVADPVPETPENPVLALQIRLLAAGFDPGPLDGQDGPRTQAALRASQGLPPISRDVSPTPAHTTVGECTGFAVPDWIIMRESGGNPSAYNPSGAYGCAQTLLGHYNDGGACAGDDPYTIDGQRDCVWRLSNGGTNLRPWSF